PGVERVAVSTLGGPDTVEVSGDYADTVDLKVDTGTGDDTVRLTSEPAAGISSFKDWKVSIDTGDGADAVPVQAPGAPGDEVAVYAGGGADTVEAAIEWFASADQHKGNPRVSIDTGDDADAVAIKVTGVAGGDVAVNTGSGADTVEALVD